MKYLYSVGEKDLKFAEEFETNDGDPILEEIAIIESIVEEMAEEYYRNNGWDDGLSLIFHVWEKETEKYLDAFKVDCEYEPVFYVNNKIFQKVIK